MESTIEVPRDQIDETIARASDPDAIGVFGYGLLIWDPRFEPLETGFTTLDGLRL